VFLALVDHFVCDLIATVNIWFMECFDDFICTVSHILIFIELWIQFDHGCFIFIAMEDIIGEKGYI
jgi:hypothetical protein